MNVINKLFLPLTAAALVAGCATSSGVKNPSGVPVTRMNADEQGFVAGTGIESQDLVAVSDKMSRGILSIPQIANAATAPIIATPKNNRKTGWIPPDAMVNATTVGPAADARRSQPVAAAVPSARIRVG